METGERRRGKVGYWIEPSKLDVRGRNTSQQCPQQHRGIQTSIKKLNRYCDSQCNAFHASLPVTRI